MGLQPGMRGLAISPDGKTGWVAFSLDDALLELDLTIPAVRGGVDVSAAGAMLSSQEALLSPDAKTLYVANVSAGNLMVVDTANRRVRAVIPVRPQWTQCLSSSPNGASTYVTTWDGRLCVIASGDSSYRLIQVPGFAFIIATPSARRLGLLYCLGGEDDRGSLRPVFFTFDLSSNTITRRVRLSDAVWRMAVPASRFKLSPAEDVAYIGWIDYRADKGFGNLSVFDLAAFEPLVSAPMDYGVADFTVDHAAGKAYVVGLWSGGSSPGVLPIIEWDIRTRAITRRIPVSASSDHRALVIDPATRNALYVADGDHNSITKVLISSGQEVQRLRFSRARLRPYAFIEAEDCAYIVCQSSPAVFRLDLGSGELEPAFLLPGGSTGVSGGGYYQGALYFAGENTVFRVSPRDGSVLETFRIGTHVTPIALTFARDRMALVDYLGGMVGKRLLVFDAQTMKLVKETSLPADPYSDRIILSPDGSKAYITRGPMFAPTTIMIFDTATWDLRKSVEILPPNMVWSGASSFADCDFDESKRIAYVGGMGYIYKLHMDTDEVLGILTAMDVYQALGRPVGWSPTGLSGVKLSAAKDTLFVVSLDAHSMLTYDLVRERWLPEVLNLKGYNPTDTVQSPDKRYLYAINRDTDTVTMVDTAARAVVKVIGPLTGPATRIGSWNVVNAASFLAGPVAPGEMVTIFGTDIGPPALTVLQLDATGRVSSELAKTRVLFDDAPAPMIYAYADQVSAVVPYSVAGRPGTRLKIVCADEETNTIILPVRESAPGLFTADASGKGPGAILNQDGSLNSPANPASRGSVVVLFGTGEGQTEPPGVDGKLAADPLPRPALPVSVQIGGVPADVLYAGAAPQLVAGMLQVNARVPDTASTGSAAPVVLTVGTNSSQPGVSLAIR